MSDKRFKLSKYVTPSSVSNFCDENGRMLNKEVVKVLNEQQSTINEHKEAIEYLKTVIRYTIPNQMVADVFKEIGEEYE